MFQLDNRGFGLGTFILFIVIFFIAILMVAYLSDYYNIGRIPMVAGNPNVDTSKYHQYENEVKNAAETYIDRNYNGVISGDLIVIDVSKLSIKNEILEDCSGYVKVENKNSVNYKPYLKCSNYMTSGYSNSFAQ